ncbi:MAG: carboxypeptidase-like regulatory domain-containing protein, partial [Terriglobia bacterium]
MNLRRRRLQAALWGTLLAALLSSPTAVLGQGSGQLYGRVLTIAADGQPLYLVGAELALVSKADPAIRFQATSDETGAYTFSGIPTGVYTLTVTLEGYETSEQEVTVEADVLRELNLELELKAVREEVTVTGEAEGIRPEQTSIEEEISGETLQDAPLVRERFQEALPLIPGVVRGQDGLIKI